MIESFTFTNLVNGETVTLNDDVYPIVEFEMPVDVRAEDVEKAHEHGAWPTYTMMGKRIIRINEGDILAADYADYITRRRALLRAIMPPIASQTREYGQVEIGFTGMPENVIAKCAVESYEVPMESLIGARGKYMVSWKCFDPLLYGASTNPLVSDYNSTQLGRSYNKTYPKQYEALPVGYVSAVNGGELDTYMTVDILGPLVDPSLQINWPDGTGHSLDFTGVTLASGETLTVDMKARTAVSTNQGDLYADATGEWWALPIGTSQVRLYASSGSAPASATFEWRNAYML